MVKKKPAKLPKRKPGAWFIPIRGSYLPASTAGWLTYIPFTAYLIFAIVIGLKDASTLAMAVLFIVPNFAAAAAVMTYIAARKS